MMETSKRPFQKRDHHHQLGKPLKMGLLQPCIGSDMGAHQAAAARDFGFGAHRAQASSRLTDAALRAQALPVTKTFPLRGDVMMQRLCGP